MRTLVHIHAAEMAKHEEKEEELNNLWVSLSTVGGDEYEKQLHACEYISLKMEEKRRRLLKPN